jgi:hypothetical protein
MIAKIPTIAEHDVTDDDEASPGASTSIVRLIGQQPDRRPISNVLTRKNQLQHKIGDRNWL